MSAETGVDAGGKIADMANTQSYEYVKKLISTGELVTAESFCKLLGINSAQLSKAVLNDGLIAFSIDGQSFYPRLYADCTENVRTDIGRISIFLGNLSVGQKWTFFTRPKVSLGGVTPIEALAQGEFEKVLIAAQGFRER